MIEKEYYSNVTHEFCAAYKKIYQPFNMNKFHYHNVYEMYYFISGERRLFYKDRIYHIEPGDVALIKKYEIHGISDWKKAGHSLILIDFQDKFLSEFSDSDYNVFECFDKDIIVFSLNDKDKEIVYNKFNDIFLEYNNDKYGKTLMLKAQLTGLLTTITRLQNFYEDKKTPIASNRNVVEKIMKYININYNKKLLLGELADVVGYSKNYLCSVFKKTSGFTVIEYLNGIRIKNAQKYLGKTNMSVTDIAQKCGFDSITHFGRVFKNIAGCSPLQYRKSIL